jgi:hypothetical protein
MLLGHDVVADREAQTGPFASQLGREEGLKQFVFNLGRNPDAVAKFPSRWTSSRAAPAVEMTAGLVLIFI